METIRTVRLNCVVPLELNIPLDNAFWVLGGPDLLNRAVRAKVPVRRRPMIATAVMVIFRRRDQLDDFGSTSGYALCSSKSSS